MHPQKHVHSFLSSLARLGMSALLLALIFSGLGTSTAFASPGPSYLSAVKTVSGSFQPGGAVTYTITLFNSGPGDQADNPGSEFTDVLPAQLTLVSAVPTSGVTSAMLDTNTVTWNGSVPSLGFVTITIMATIHTDAGGHSVSNQGTASFDADGNGTNESTVLTDDPGILNQSDPTTFLVDCISSITVTSPSDSGAGSLRQAIMEVCGDGKITFSGDMDVPLESELTIDKNMMIDGEAHQVTLDGQDSVRVFHIMSGSIVTLNALTVANGAADGTGGGGIFNDGSTLTVTNSNFNNNHADGHVGGGILNDSGTLNVTNTTFDGNHSNNTGKGGGIFNYDGTATVTNSIFSKNHSDTDSEGGGIGSVSGTLTVNGCTFDSNHADAGIGGGLFTWLSTVSIANSTFSSNQAGLGGGIYNSGNTINVVNSTFFSNDGGYGGGIYTTSGVIISNSTFSGNSSGDGGGIRNFSFVTLKNTIIANSTSGGNCSNSSSGTFTDGGGNLVWGDTSCPGINADPQLGPLADNGGPTKTMALGAKSAARDAGNDATCAAAVGAPNYGAGGKDQRGEIRPSGPHCDIGAYEKFSLIVSTTTTLVASPNPSTFGQSVTFTATVSPAPDSGKVAFKDNGTIITGCDAQSLSSGQAACSTSTLSIGSHVITAEYNGTPDYAASNGMLLPDQQVNQATPVITWADPAAIEQGTPLSAIQLNATADVPGAFTYTPAEGTYLSAGTHTLHVDFVPTDAVNYANASKEVSLTINDHVIFSDVPGGYWARSFIERLYLDHVTGGCGTTPLRYCPDQGVTRAQLAVLLLRAKYGSPYLPPEVGTGTGFGDVPVTHWAAAWIKQLAAEDITAGCGGGKFCPEQVVTRAEMAVLLLRANYGNNYIPPTAAGLFDDVPAEHWAAAWIEQLVVEGITGGCGNNNYCPNAPVTRAQIAVFLVIAFDLP